MAQKNPDDAKAWFNIGVLYETGQSTEKNQTKAHDAYKKSIALGYAPAMYNLGSIYAKQKDYENARLWWEKAAELDLPEAQYNMGMLYEKGWGVSVNPQLSSSWYQRAAETAMEKYFQLYQKSRSEHSVELVPSENSISVFDRLLFIKTAFAASTKIDSDAIEKKTATALVELAQTQNTAQNTATSTNQQPRSPGWDWVYSQPAESYTIQLFATKDVDKTGKFIQQYALSERAQVIQAIVKGTTYYKVILGSFEQWNDAAVEIGAFPQDLRNQRPWVRKFNSLYKELPDTIIASSKPSQVTVSGQPEVVEDQGIDSKLQSAQETAAQTAQAVPESASGQQTSTQTQAVIEEISDQVNESVSDQQASSENTQQAEITQIESDSVAAGTEVQDVVDQNQESLTQATVSEMTTDAEDSAESIQHNPDMDDMFNAYVNKQLASSGLSDALKSQLKTGLDAIADGDHARGYDNLNKLADSGLPEAQYRVALLYLEGNGVERSADKAFAFMKAASEQGHPYAQQSLAKFYSNGVGVEANSALATYWQQTAADNIKKLELQ